MARSTSGRTDSLSRVVFLTLSEITLDKSATASFEVTRPELNVAALVIGLAVIGIATDDGRQVLDRGFVIFRGRVGRRTQFQSANRGAMGPHQRRAGAGDGIEVTSASVQRLGPAEDRLVVAGKQGKRRVEIGERRLAILR